MADFGVYAHIPWCVEKCPYCDFNSHKEPEHIDEQAYINRLLGDLTHDAKQLSDQTLRSLFIGGGTPSLLSANSIASFLRGFEQTLQAHCDQIEVTLEANPGTFEQEKFALYRQAGVNRLSIGIQSFDPLQLTNLGRIHNSGEAHNAISVARKAGFDNINLDLMFGLPGQSKQDALRDLQTAIDYSPNHISWYQLTIEPNTAFYSNPPTLPDDDDIHDLHEAGLAMLAASGYEQYEVSAFAKPGYQSEHNQVYWRFDDYLGLGAGAHGKLTLDGAVYRTQRTRLPKHYLASRPEDVRTKMVARDDLGFEFMLNRLRLKQPFNLNSIKSMLDITATVRLEAAVADAISRKLLVQSGDMLTTTDLGWRHLNALLTLFLTEDS